MLLLPQRYKFSSKSQPKTFRNIFTLGCCCYRKGTNFQANHNPHAVHLFRLRVVVATAKVQIFKQITTYFCSSRPAFGCCCYRKGTNFQANHNRQAVLLFALKLLLLPQRYKFSSKSQHQKRTTSSPRSCCCYRKGTNFQANHNEFHEALALVDVVVATAKVQIFKQITTDRRTMVMPVRCCCYRKGTNFQANHNFK